MNDIYNPLRSNQLKSNTLKTREEVIEALLTMCRLLKTGIVQVMDF